MAGPTMGACPVAGLQESYPYLREERARHTCWTHNQGKPYIVNQYKTQKFPQSHIAAATHAIGPPGQKLIQFPLGILKVGEGFPSIIITTIPLPPYEVLLLPSYSPFLQHFRYLILSLLLILQLHRWGCSRGTNHRLELRAVEDWVQLPSRRQGELPGLPGDLPGDGEGASPFLRQLPSTFSDWEVGSGQPHLHANRQVSRAALGVRQLSHAPRGSRLGLSNLGVNFTTI